MVVAHIFGHQPFQMALIQDDYVIQQVSSATSYPAFRNAVLPWAAKCGADPLGSYCPSGGCTSLPNFESRSNNKNLRVVA
jgi:hypothetical protein